MLLLLVPAFLSGMMLPLCLPFLPNKWVIVSLLIVSLVLIMLRFLLTHLPSKLKSIMLFTAAFILGLVWFSYNAQQQLSLQLPKSLENIPLTVEGTISSLPVIKYEQLQFQFNVAKVCAKQQCQALPLTVLLNWQNPPKNLMVGQGWQLQVKLKRPHGFANSGSFDREAFLFQNGIRATGAINDHVKTATSPSIVVGDNHPLTLTVSWASRLASIRQHYDAYILASLNSLPFAGVIDALTVGNSAAITQQQWQVFRNTGTTHLIAISGLHIGMIAALFYIAGGWLWRRSTRACLWLPSQKAAAWFGMLGAFLYTAFSGFSIPAERTLIMIIAWMGTLLIGRYSLSSQRFLLGLAMVLLINPFAVMNLGFWLSFSAIALIGYGMQARLAPAGLWWRFGRVQWVAGVGLIPLSWLLFQQTSLVGFFANMIAIPWVGWVTVPIALLGCALAPLSLSLSQGLLWIAEKTLEVLWPYLHYLSSCADNSWFLGLYNPWLIVPAMLTVLLILAPAQFPGRWLAVLWLLPVVSVKAPKLPEKALKLTVLDVGQGLAVIVQTRAHTLVYDTGIGYPDGYNMGDVVLIPFFHSQHIYHLDKLIISHGDSDHAGGAKTILAHFPGLPLLTSAPANFANYPAVQNCEAGQHWQWDGVNFAMLYPFAGQAAADNNTSCVLQISAGEQRVLLPGDIEKTAEALLVSRYPAQLGATVLLAPHHGSISSSTMAFVNAVHPQITIFATGYLNRYHFPSNKVRLRYQSLSSLLYNPADDGAITVILQSGKVPEISTYRAKFKHFWAN